MAEAPKVESVPTVTASGVQVLSGPIPPGAAGGAVPQNPPGQPTFAGVAGGGFTIDGARFDQIGYVTLNGQPLTVTKWENNKVKGLLPADAQYGEVVLTDGTGKEQKMHYGPQGPGYSVKQLQRMLVQLDELKQDIQKQLAAAQEVEAKKEEPPKAEAKK